MDIHTGPKKARFNSIVIPEAIRSTLVHHDMRLTVVLNVLKVYAACLVAMHPLYTLPYFIHYRAWGRDEARGCLHGWKDCDNSPGKEQSGKKILLNVLQSSVRAFFSASGLNRTQAYAQSHTALGSGETYRCRGAGGRRVIDSVQYFR